MPAEKLVWYQRNKENQTAEDWIIEYNDGGGWQEVEYEKQQYDFCYETEVDVPEGSAVRVAATNEVGTSDYSNIRYVSEPGIEHAMFLSIVLIVFISKFYRGWRHGNPR